MAKYRILSLDGGGLRGIIPVLILKRIEEMTGKKIYELFDCIVGTSTGGIIAAGLTATKDGKTTHLDLDTLSILIESTAFTESRMRSESFFFTVSNKEASLIKLVLVLLEKLNRIVISNTNDTMMIFLFIIFCFC